MPLMGAMRGAVGGMRPQGGGMRPQMGGQGLGPNPMGRFGQQMGGLMGQRMGQQMQRPGMRMGQQAPMQRPVPQIPQRPMNPMGNQMAQNQQLQRMQQNVAPGPIPGAEMGVPPPSMGAAPQWNMPTSTMQEGPPQAVMMPNMERNTGITGGLGPRGDFMQRLMQMRQQQGGG